MKGKERCVGAGLVESLAYAGQYGRGKGRHEKNISFLLNSRGILLDLLVSVVAAHSSVIVSLPHAVFESAIPRVLQESLIMHKLLFRG